MPAVDTTSPASDTARAAVPAPRDEPVLVEDSDDAFAAVTGLHFCRQHRARLRRSGILPPLVYVGARGAYVRAELRAAIERLIADRVHHAECRARMSERGHKAIEKRWAKQGDMAAGAAGERSQERQ